jgi:hypothetical protein
MPAHPDLELRCNELLAALRIEGPAADQLRPQVLALLGQVRADAFDTASRITRPGPIERSRYERAVLEELGSLSATFDAASRVTRQGKAWPPAR